MNKFWIKEDNMTRRTGMSVENKRKLSTICYYTLAILTFAVACLFGYALIIRRVAMWARIVYFIWLALVLGTVVFDIVCTHNNRGKEITGMIVYILTILSIIVAAILYFTNAGIDGLVDNLFNMFISVSLLSVTVVGLLIATWIVGESLVEHRTAGKEIEVQKINQ